MEIFENVYGAQIKVYVQYEGTLQEVGYKLQKALNISTFRYEYMEDEPYDLAGYAEIFGFEIELKESKDNESWRDYQFLLEATTTDSFQEIIHGRMYDISFWMARYIALMCEVTTLVENPDKKTGQSFYINKNNYNRESRCVELKK